MPQLFFRKGFIAVASLSLTVLAGCAGKQVALTDKIQAQAAKRAETRVVTPSEAIALAEEEMAKAIEENLDFFSPLHLKQAQDSLSLAKSTLQKPLPGQPNAPIEAALSAREFLKKGFENKADVNVYLKEAIAHKRLLQKLDVPKRYPEAYGEVLFEFSNIIKIIEEGDPDIALNKQKPLRSKMYTLEIDALIAIHLGEPVKVLGQAEQNDAERYAPVSFQNAQYKINATENYIRTNYRDRNGIRKAGEDSLLLAQEAHEVGIESKKIMNLDSAASEQYVLGQIKRLNTYGSMLGIETLPPQSIERSNLDIKAAIERSQSQNKNLAKRVDSLEKELKKYTSISLQGLEEQDSAGVNVLQTFESKDLDLDKEPSLGEDEQGFDSVEFME